MKNYYEVLEISENASQEVIERVYKLFAKKYHPDLNPDNVKEAEEKFKEITEAYETLSDEQKRKSYDDKLRFEKQKAERAKASSAGTSAYSSSYKSSNNNSAGQNTAKKDTNIKKTENYSNEETYYSTQDSQTLNDIIKQVENELQKEREYQIKKAYNDAYIEALQSMGVKVVYKKTFKEKVQMVKNLLLFFIIMAIVLFIAYQIPEVKEQVNGMIELFKSNIKLS